MFQLVKSDFHVSGCLYCCDEVMEQEAIEGVWWKNVRIYTCHTMSHLQGWGNHTGNYLLLILSTCSQLNT